MEPTRLPEYNNRLLSILDSMSTEEVIEHLCAWIDDGAEQQFLNALRQKLTK